jgi:hypothetical protein
MDFKRSLGLLEVTPVVLCIGDPLPTLCLLQNSYDIALMYARSQSAIFEAVTKLVEFLEENWKHLLDFDHHHLLSLEKSHNMHLQSTVQVHISKLFGLFLTAH